jgi:hypothetical protein
MRLSFGASGAAITDCNIDTMLPSLVHLDDEDRDAAALRIPLKCE